MSGFVADASVTVSWVYESQATEETDWLLNEVISGVIVVVPPLWFLEVANALLIAQRRRKLSAAFRRAVLKTLDALGVEVDEEGHRVAFQRTSEIAEKYGLTLYDAVYLQLAIRRKLPLASRDKALIAAAKKSGIKIF